MAVFTVIYAAGVVVALFALLAACISDFRSMTIPNRWPVMVAVGFVLAYAGAGFGGMDVFSSLAVHAVAFALMFAVGVWGAGDSKLAAAVSLWLGLIGVVPFLLGMSVAGLLLVAVFPVLKRAPQVPVWLGAESWWARVARGEKSVPYGIAIALGALWTFYRLGYFHL